MNDQLIEEAINMREHAIAPYSKYKVGSAVLTDSGKIFGGCNVESSSYGLTCCAERIALYNAISNGYTKFTALAVATKNGGYPCGACLQVIWDLCGEISIYISDISGNIKNKTSSELLPNAFDKSSL
tara:strand:- start:422 stop:802 length:381 start_codon:yes stop_codon:yes gene_type:complete